jgi:hypothetical protein|nr:MAG TPA: Baseplate component [Caudoviricetes sp.]
MEHVEHRIKLDLMKAGLQGQVIVKKADSDSRKINIFLSSTAGPYNMKDITSAILRAEKPDGKVMFNSCTVCEDRLEYIITTQTIAATGTVTCEITLMSSTGQVLVTPQFEIIVADIIYSDTEIESTNEYTALEEAIKKAAALKDGTTFTPSVSDEGVLSWSNSDGKDNPAAVNIKGPKGDPGDKGDKGDPGKDGADGSTGAAGADGVTPHIGENGNWFIESTDTGKPSRGGSTAEDISYMLSEDIQNDFPELAELESNTVKNGLDVAIYYAFAGMFAKYIQCDVQSATGTVQFDLQNLFDNSIMPALKQAHEHDNKSILDHFSDSNGALKYNGNFIIPQKISEGPYITLADNTEYRLTDVTTLKLTYPVGDFECWMRLTFAASGTITVTLPADTKYIGTAPDFKNGETWELSFKDKVLAAQKVGEGT